MLQLHHIGFIVENMDEATKSMARTLGVAFGGSEPTLDPVRKVRVLFGELAPALRVELIEPVDDSSPVYRGMLSSVKLAHLCYEAADIDASLARAQEQGAILVLPPTPSPALDNRRMAILYYGVEGLVELLEKEA